MYDVEFVFLFLYVFVNDTWPTESYSYLPTRSQPDDLPLSSPDAASTPRETRPNKSTSYATSIPVSIAQSSRLAPVARWPAGRRPYVLLAPMLRSEEHTSELQSLMRI